MNRFLKGAMILTLAGIIVKVIGAFSKVLIARVLGGEALAIYDGLSNLPNYRQHLCGRHSSSDFYYDCGKARQ